jgi:hypothetical protein
MNIHNILGVDDICVGDLGKSGRVHERLMS